GSRHGDGGRPKSAQRISWQPKRDDVRVGPWRYTAPMRISRTRLVATLVLLTGHALSTRAQVSPQAPRVGREAYAPGLGASLFSPDTGGAGIPVVFLHAATGTTSAWQHQTPAFAAAGYRAVAYDRRGWGRTITDAGGPAGTGADDLLGLLETLKLDRVH